MGSASTPVQSRLGAAGATLVRELIAAEAVSALKHDGLRTVVLKGPAVARWLYGSASQRGYGDSDLLVSPDDFDAAEETIAALGYQPRSESLAGDRPWTARFFMRPRDGAALDLHRTLPGIDVSPETAWSLLSAETEVVTMRGEEVEFLNEPARALHLALHAADHGFTSEQPLKDLMLALETLPDVLWGEAADLAVTLDAAATFAAGLRLLPEGTELAARLGLPANSLEAALRASSATRHALGLQWLLQTQGLGAKASLLARKLVPPPAYMRAWSRLAQEGLPGLILAYLWRPLYLALVATPTVMSWWRARRRLRRCSPSSG